MESDVRNTSRKVFCLEAPECCRPKHCSSSRQHVVGDNGSFRVTWCPCNDSALARSIFKLSSSLPPPRGFSGTGTEGGNERVSSSLGGVASARICRRQYAQGVPRKGEHVDGVYEKEGKGTVVEFCLTSLRGLRSCSNSWPADCIHLITSSPL